MRPPTAVLILIAVGHPGTLRGQAVADSTQVALHDHTKRPATSFAQTRPKCSWTPGRGVHSGTNEPTLPRLPVRRARKVEISLGREPRRIDDHIMRDRAQPASSAKRDPPMGGQLVEVILQHGGLKVLLPCPWLECFVRHLQLPGFGLSSMQGHLHVLSRTGTHASILS